MSPVYHRLRAYAPLCIFVPKLRRVGRNEELKLWWSLSFHSSSLELGFDLTTRVRECRRSCERLEEIQLSGLLPCVPSSTALGRSEAMVVALLGSEGPIGLAVIANGSHE